MKTQPIRILAEAMVVVTAGSIHHHPSNRLRASESTRLASSCPSDGGTDLMGIILSTILSRFAKGSAQLLSGTHFWCTLIHGAMWGDWQVDVQQTIRLHLLFRGIMARWASRAACAYEWRWCILSRDSRTVLMHLQANESIAEGFELTYRWMTVANMISKKGSKKRRRLSQSIVDSSFAFAICHLLAKAYHDCLWMPL